ncbi:hypothetical protein B0H14DRAFT_2574020 [Mycena olivaceomarginata]|nr:hypothetical protein B0H14DRAFT_2574020 [Mycena olivaceomarginata]
MAIQGSNRILLSTLSRTTPVSTSETVDPQGTVGESQPEVANGQINLNRARWMTGMQMDAFVCTACETTTEELYPWDYIRRYREEVGYVKEAKEPLASLKNPSAHGILHMLIRFGNTASTQAADGLATDISQVLHDVEQCLLGRMDEDKRQMEQRLARIEALLEALLLGNAERS